MHDPLTRIIVSAPVFLLAVVFHEVAHGYVAYLCGDDTAKRAGRLTFSPIAHLDPIGTLCFIVSAYAGVGFGWAKPVPIVTSRMRHPGRDEILVTLAGPGSNLLQAVVWALLFRVLIWLPAARALSFSMIAALVNFLVLGVVINLVLMLFNLLPIPPLDGSHVAFRILGIKDPYMIARLSGLGMIVLLALLITPVFGTLVHAVVGPIGALLAGVPIGL